MSQKEIHITISKTSQQNVAVQSYHYTYHTSICAL